MNKIKTLRYKATQSKPGRRALCLLLALVMLALSAQIFVSNDIAVYAEESAGVIVGTGVNFRSGAGTGYSSYGQFPANAQVTILGTSGEWVQVSYDGKTGYVHSNYIVRLSDTSAGTDEAFEASIAGFPESYKPALRRLHQIYPNWTFTADFTNLNWDDAVAAESQYGRSLVSKNAVAQMKSTMDAVYDPATGQWAGLDGGTWTQASVQAVEHYLDPRTYLDTTHIYAFMDQSYNSAMESVYATGVARVLEGSYFANPIQNSNADTTTISFADVFIEAGRTYGVNPIVTASTVRIEQGRCQSPLILGQGVARKADGVVDYVDYYNFFNVGAYQDDTRGVSERGLWYASGQGTGQTSYGRPWNTRTRAIMGGTQFYAENYIGQGQNTLYYKKFNVSPSSSRNTYTHQYMTNIQAVASESSTQSEAYATLSDLALNFIIPVYNNMPDSPVAKPTSNVVGSGDYSSSRAVNTAHSSFVNSGQSGNTSGQGTSVAEPTVSSSLNISGSTVAGIQPASTVDAVASAMGVSNGSVVITNTSGQTISGSTAVGTGSTVSVLDTAGQVRSQYTVVVHGDINGDGRVSAADLLRVQKSILGIVSLDGATRQAADTNGDGQISAIDLLRIQKHILGISTLAQ